MLRRFMPFVFLLIVSSIVVGSQELELAITVPADGNEVYGYPVVSGTVSDPASKIWLVVHPTATSDYWVQDPVFIDEDGNWQGQVTVGRPGSVDVGAKFEIIAVANPKKKIKAGDVFKSWPKAQSKSNVIKVTRK